MRTTVAVALVVLAGSGCRRSSHGDPISEGPMIELDAGVAVATAVGSRIHWLIEGRSGQRGIGCKDVDATSVIVRVKDAENPKRDPQVFRVRCDAAETVLPVALGKHLLTAQLWASTGRVLSATREEPVDVTDAGSSLTLLFEVVDGQSLSAK